MKIIKWTLVIIAALSVGYILNYLALDSDLWWAKSLYEKKIKILRQFTNTGRVIVAGGSGTHYGIDAARMEQLLGRPVINTGNHGGIGLNAIIGTIEGEVKNGDIVILISEYGLLADDGTGWLSAAFGVSIGMPGIGGIGIKQTIQEIFKGGTLSLTSFGKSVMRLFFNAKGRTSNLIDEHGDVVIYINRKVSPSSVSSVVSSSAGARLISFKKSVDNKGAKLFFALPWVLVSVNDKESRMYVMNIISELNKIAPVLYNKETLGLYDNAAFFSDTPLHNTKETRATRSLELVEQLNQAIN